MPDAAPVADEGNNESLLRFFRVSCIVAIALIGSKSLSAQDFGTLALPASPYPLEGWETLKFGMTPRQTCNALNQIGMKCAIEEVHPTEAECRGLQHLGFTCSKPHEEISVKNNQVRIGMNDWSVRLSFDNTPPTEGGVDIGNLSAIRLSMCGPAGGCGGSIDPCYPESYIGDLERQYGPFWRDPAPDADGTHYGNAIKRFANGAFIQVEATHPSRALQRLCLSVEINYSNPNVHRLPPPPPPPPTGHF